MSNGQGRDWEAYAMNHAANQMQAQRGQAFDQAAARSQAYLGQQQAACKQQYRTEETADVITVPAGELGEIHIDGKLLRMVKYTAKLEMLAEAVAHEAGKLYEAKRTHVPTHEEYARALFEADPEVQTFIRNVADGVLRTEDPEFNLDAFDRAMRVAWQRDENGWRTRAWYHAAALITSLNRGRSLRQSDKHE